MGAAHAEDAGEKMFSFSGFGTIGMTNSSEKSADYVRIVDTPKGAGHSSATSASGESRLGAQVDGTFSDRLSGVVQVVSEYRPDGSYRPDIELAQLKFQVTPALDFRAGRMAIPWFVVSDYLKVGYAVPWLRAPSVVYRTAMSHYDGAETRYKFTVGGAALTAQALFGTTGTDIASNPAGGEATKLKLHNFTGLNLQGDYGASSARIGLMTSTMTLKNSGLAGIFDAYRAQGDTALATTYDANGSRTSYIALGYTYDPGNWFVQSEITKLFGSKSMVPMYTSGYVSGGYRFGNFKPYVTLGRFRTDSDTSIGSADPGVAAFGGAQVINALLGNGISSSHSTLSVGARWDFKDNMALKVQVDHTKNDAHSNGGLKNLQPGFIPGDSYRLISAAVDFVF
ncbi:hypothetical protein D0T25_24045 [Duganella sp. BJB488]|nr:hypothetical protein D0T25_24045 [Duganella sp. BJB488]